MNILETLKKVKLSGKAVMGLSILGLLIVGGISYKIVSSPSDLKGLERLLAKKERSFPVEVQEVEIDKISKFLTSVGTLIAHQSVAIKSDVPGRVKQILFTDGFSVKKDDLLIEFDDETEKASLKIAEAQYELAKADFDRNQELHDKKYLSSKEREKAVATLKQREGELDAARAKLAKTKLKSPFDGVVGVMKDVSIGTYVQPSQELVTVVNLNPMKVDFKVPGSYLKAVQVGQKVKIKVDGYDEEVQGEIEAIDSKVDAVGHGLLIRAKLANQDGRLKPGLFVRVSVVIGENDKAFVVPEKAIDRNGNEESVFIVFRNMAKKVPVVTGVRDSGRVEILKGLNPKDRVIIAGNMNIKDGYPVAVNRTVTLTDKK